MKKKTPSKWVYAVKKHTFIRMSMPYKRMCPALQFTKVRLDSSRTNFFLHIFHEKKTLAWAYDEIHHQNHSIRIQRQWFEYILWSSRQYLPIAADLDSVFLFFFNIFFIFILWHWSHLMVCCITIIIIIGSSRRSIAIFDRPDVANFVRTGKSWHK